MDKAITAVLCTLIVCVTVLAAMHLRHKWYPISAQYEILAAADGAIYRLNKSTGELLRCVDNLCGGVKGTELYVHKVEGKPSQTSSKCDCPSDRLNVGRQCGGLSLWCMSGGKEPNCPNAKLSDCAASQ